jgi:hypothetical protein
MHIIILVVVLICCLTVQGGLFGRKKEEEKKYEPDAKESVALGIDMMKKSSSDPEALKEAMSMMNDPETKKV